MTVSFYDASDGSLIDIVENVPSGGKASVIWHGLNYETKYSWYAVSNDSHLENKSDTWSFTTEIKNNAPVEPYNPSPINEASGVQTNPEFSWNCNDPDGNNIEYDIYFGTDKNNLQKVSNKQSSKTYKPETLNYTTKYYWKIIAFDSLGDSSISPIWCFITKESIEYKIKGFSFGCAKLDITNKGDKKLKDITWNISVKGGFLGLLDTSANGEISSFDAGKTITLSTVKGEIKRGFGLVLLKLDIVIPIDDSKPVEKTIEKNGFVIGGFVIFI
jgi:hypothetical protein